MQSPNAIHLLLLIGLFAFVFAGALGAMLLFTPKDMRRRIEQAGGLARVALSPNSTSAASALLEKIADMSEPIAKLSVPKEGWENSALRVHLMNAGWRSQNAAPLYFAAKTLLALIVPLAQLPWLLRGSLAANPLMLSAVLIVFGGIGYYMPNKVLNRRVKLRQRTIFEDFPDALDLLTVCIEAGLSLDAGMMRVAEEIKIRSAVVASELELFMLELRSGFTREKALRNLSLRTGVEDIDSFCTMLIQTERFGTSIADSLRVLSETLRTRRRMRAEEQAAKIALKLLLPLAFCIFPALLTVLLGPAMIHVYRILLPTMNGTGG